MSDDRMRELLNRQCETLKRFETRRLSKVAARDLRKLIETHNAMIDHRAAWREAALEAWRQELKARFAEQITLS